MERGARQERGAEGGMEKGRGQQEGRVERKEKEREAGERKRD